MNMRPNRSACVILWAICAWASLCQAGGGPQNVVVVVNTRSWASLSVANEYIRQRNISPSHVIALDLPFGRMDDATDVASFREHILAPVLAAIKDRGLQSLVDCVAYSADIPTAIDFSKDVGGGDVAGEIGSVNGLTFLHEMVLARKAYWDLGAQTNAYYRESKPKAGGSIASASPPSGQNPPMFDVEPSLALSTWASRNIFDNDGSAASATSRAGVGAAARPCQKPHYLLSTVLAVTSGRGMTVKEAMANLRLAPTADGTNPAGTFYYMMDWGIRTTTREPWFKSAIARLEAMGRKAKQINDPGPYDIDHAIAMPRDVDDILGAMLGQQWPTPARSHSKIVPGAMIDNLTSEGGIMCWWGMQTPATDFLRAGAAGASGVVIEPYAIWQKFASPFLFAHYASGCTMAEAYYQSVHSPYQLLILGDPLCQPFAKMPTVRVEGLQPGQVVPATWSVQQVKASTVGDPKAPCDITILIDGSIFSSTPSSQPGSAHPLAPGYHELLAVATQKDEAATQGSRMVPFFVGAAPKLAFVSGSGSAVLGSAVKIHADVAGAGTIELRHCGRVIGTVQGTQGDCEINTSQLGIGPARLDAVATVDGKQVATAPLWVDVVSPKPMSAITVAVPPGQALVDGPMLTGKEFAPSLVLDMKRRDALVEARIPVGAQYAMDAYFNVGADDLCQFQVWTDGELMLTVDGRLLSHVTLHGWTFVPISLAQGLHVMNVRGTAGPQRELEIRFGPPGTRRIGARCHAYESDHLAMHFSHLGPKPPPASAPAPAASAPTPVTLAPSPAK
jgi:hypothetical protein